MNTHRFSTWCQGHGIAIEPDSDTVEVPVEVLRDVVGWMYEYQDAMQEITQMMAQYRSASQVPIHTSKGQETMNADVPVHHI